jgi:hypothetical protein
VIGLSFVDNGDGTGGVLTISGSPAGSNNTVYYLMFAGGVATGDFQVGPSRVGDGIVPIAIPPGPYHAFVLSDNGGAVTVGAPFGFRTSDNAPSLHERFGMAVRDYIIGLNIKGLPTLPSHHVFVKVGAKLAEVLEGTPADGAMYYIPVAENGVPADNQFNSLRFPVVVALIVPPTGGSAAKAAPMSGVPTVVPPSVCKNSPRPAFFAAARLIVKLPASGSTHGVRLAP